MTDQIGSPMQPADDAMPVCRYFNAVGGCRAGAGCRFRHMLPMHGSTGAVAGHRGYGGGSGSGRGGVSSSHQQSSGAFAAGGGTHFVPQLGACMFYSTPNGCRAGDSCRYVCLSLLPLQPLLVQLHVDVLVNTTRGAFLKKKLKIM